MQYIIIYIYYIIMQPFWQKQRDSKERYLWPSFSYWILETPVPKNLSRFLTLEEEKGESDICHSRNLFKRKGLHIAARPSCRRDWSSALMDHTLNRTAHFCTPFFAVLYTFWLPFKFISGQGSEDGFLDGKSLFIPLPNEATMNKYFLIFVIIIHL